MGSFLIQYKNTTQLTKVINWKAFAKENPEYKIEVSKDCEYWFEQNEIAAGDDIADYYLKNHNLRYDAEWSQEEYDSSRSSSRV